MNWLALRSFLIVGAAGFAIDAGILMLLSDVAGWTPWEARVPSFLTAVLVTWALNRRHAFAQRASQRRIAEAVAYALIQVTGALINLVIFGACLHFFAALYSFPVIPLAIGAIGGLGSNYILCDQVLYRIRRDHS